MRQQRELLHSSEEDENLHRSTGVRGNSLMTRGNLSLNVLRAVGCTGRHSEI